MTKIKNIFAAIKNTDTEKKNALIAQIGVILMLCVSPLFLTNRYLKLTVSKLIFFCVVAFLLFVLLNLSLASSKKLSKSDFISKDYHETALWCFFVFGIISCIASDYPLDALTGSPGRFMGLITVFALLAIFLAVSRFFIPKTWVVYTFAFFSIILNLTAALQFSGFNPFGLYTGMSEKTVESFISTLGNENVYGAYLCLLVPFFMTFAIKSAKTAMKIISHITLLFAFIGVFAAKCDGVFLGILFMFAVAVYWAGRHREEIFDIAHCFLLFFIAASFTAVITHFELIKFYKLASFTKILINTPVLITCLAVCSVIVLLSKFIPGIRGFFAIVFRLFFYILIAALAAFAAAFIYFTFINKTADLGRFTDILRFSDDWGSDRGYIWKYVIKIFSDYSPIHKLFGCGEDCLYTVFKESYGTKIASVKNGTVDNAHCDYLHILVNQGVLGLSSYIAFLFFTLKKAISDKSVFNKAALCASAAYLVQAAVNLWQPITTPLLFVFLALSVCKNNTGDKETPSM